MRFGFGVPTGTEGMMYPVPYADIDQAVQLAVEAERLGFDSVWGNDHVSTQAYVRAEFADPPRFYDPYLYLAYVAGQTTTLGLGTAVTVMSFRSPVVVAKQAATLDLLSGGRFHLGLGIGAYREEAEAMWADRALHRGRHADELMEEVDYLFHQALVGAERVSSSWCVPCSTTPPPSSSTTRSASGSAATSATSATATASQAPTVAPAAVRACPRA